MQYAESGWYFDSIEKQGVLHIKLPNTSVTAEKVITLSNGKIYPHVCLVACGGANGPAQGFVGPTTATSGQIVHSGGAGMCLTASDDPDVDSHTPAVELQPCSKYSKPRQQQLASKHIVNGSILSVGSTRVDCFFKGGPQGKLEILKLVSVQLLENHEMLRKPEHVKNRERGPRAGRAKQPDLPEAARQRPPGDMVWGIREHV